MCYRRQITILEGSALQVAQFTAELGQYPEAIGIYEDVARRCVDNNLLKYSAKGYLLNAGICHLCGKLLHLLLLWTYRQYADEELRASLMQSHSECICIIRSCQA